jgi:hypothetical protein
VNPQAKVQYLTFTKMKQKQKQEIGDELED